MTVLETQALNSVIDIAHQLRVLNANEIDWEKRRYELVKDLINLVISKFNTTNIKYWSDSYKEDTIEECINLADTVIEKLKHNNKDGE